MDYTAIKERGEFLSIAEAYIDKNLYKEAAHISELWLKRYPLDAEANIIRCHALLKMGDLEKVSELIDDLEVKVLELSRVYYRVGDLCMDAGLTKEAIKFYRKFIFLKPAAESAREVFKKINALTAYDDSSTERGRNGGSNTAHAIPDFCTTTLAELYIRQGHLDMAVSVLGEILKREPENKTVADRLNDVMEMQHDGMRKNTSLHMKQDETLIKELTRWLENIERLRSDAL